MLWSFVVLAILLVLVSNGPSQIAFEALASALAFFAGQFLTIGGFDVLRSGAELRAIDGQWAVKVTEVCDGHGLLAAWLLLAMVWKGPRPTRAAIRWLLAGVVAIQAFNLARIIILAATIATSPGTFEFMHLTVFPLATALLMVTLAAPMAGIALRHLALIAMIAIMTSLVWYALSGPLSALVLAPSANLILGFLQPEALGLLEERSATWVLRTRFVASAEPLRLHLAAINPADFAIFLPVLLAVLAFSRRLGQAVVVLAASLIMATLATALGAMTAAWSLVEHLGVRTMVIDIGSGQVREVAYSLPAETLRSGAAVVQNTIVHFNLLVLPAVCLTTLRKAADAD